MKARGAASGHHGCRAGCLAAVRQAMLKKIKPVHEINPKESEGQRGLPSVLSPVQLPKSSDVSQISVPYLTAALTS